MTIRRIGLAPLMALIAVFALGLGTMKVASEGMEQAIVLGSLAALLVATVGAIVRPRARAGWIGCAVFGWGYSSIVLGEAVVAFPLPDNTKATKPFRIDGLARKIAIQLHPLPPWPVNPVYGKEPVYKQNDGLYYGHFNVQEFPLAAADQILYPAYLNQLTAYKEASKLLGRATNVGLAYQGIAFAVVGAFIGSFLAQPTSRAIFEEAPR